MHLSAESLIQKRGRIINLSILVGAPTAALRLFFDGGHFGLPATALVVGLSLICATLIPAHLVRRRQSGNRTQSGQIQETAAHLPGNSAPSTREHRERNGARVTLLILEATAALGCGVIMAGAALFLTFGS